MKRSFLPFLPLALVLLGSLTHAHQVTPWRDPSPHRVDFVAVDNGVRLEILDWRGSGPPVVLLGCYLSADEFAPKLGDRFHAHGITRRGIGASDRSASGYTVQRSVADVLEVLDSLKLRRSLLLGTPAPGKS